MCIAGGSVQELQGAGFNAAGTSSPNTPLHHVDAHEHLFFEGDTRDRVYIVESGWVKLYRTLIDGQRQVVGFANAGSVLGLESEKLHANSCEAITRVVVRAIPASRLNGLCRSEPALANQILRQISRQLGAAQAQLAIIGAQSAEQKLAAFLLSVSALCDERHDSDFELPMRRRDMAEFLGLRLETVSRKMADFQRRRWIRISEVYRCHILDRSILEALAQGGSITVNVAPKSAPKKRVELLHDSAADDVAPTCGVNVTDAAMIPNAPRRSREHSLAA